MCSAFSKELEALQRLTNDSAFMQGVNEGYKDTVTSQAMNFAAALERYQDVKGKFLVIKGQQKDLARRLEEA